ncbi:MAG: type I 3-dehydroquinate dehydratase [Candidatus Faecousia sp.]|nr:type I 3-dehydroquinate dehydratase [Candidatus Faecousia sp.]
MKKSFLNREKPWLTLLFRPKSADIALDTIHRAISDGVEAFCLQTEALCPEDRNPETYRKLFAAMGERPVYTTNYRQDSNEKASDEQIAAGLLELAHCGATVCDVMGDLFDPQPGEMTVNPAAVKKQEQLIDELHAAGAEVLMSCHVFRFTPAEEVLEIARNQQSRGVDIVKIVTGADTMEQQLENLRITHLLKQELKVPFLFLSGGMCEIHRRIGPMLGCCMYLCSLDDSVEPKPFQPMLRKTKQIWENWW